MKKKKARKFVHKLVLPPNLSISFSDTEVGNADRVLKTDTHETDSKIERMFCGNSQVSHIDGECIEPNPLLKKEFKVSTKNNRISLTSLANEYYGKVRSPAVTTVFFSAAEVRQMKGLAACGKIGRLVPPSERKMPSDYDRYVYFSGKGGVTQFLIYSSERKFPYEPVSCIYRESANHPVTEDYFFALSFAKISQVPLEDVSFRLGKNGVVIIRGVRSGKEVIVDVDQTSHRNDIEREIEMLDQSSEDGNFMRMTPVSLLPLKQKPEKTNAPSKLSNSNTSSIY